ncbi:MAG: hypothetical protein JWQ88_326, partial [Rhodoferax sp.]|nr:hypothetical protein [Rhodoferax sp.]
MPRLDLPLGPLNSLRQDAASLGGEQAQLDAQVAQQASLLTALQRQGADAPRRSEAEATLAQLRQRRAELARRRSEVDQRLDAGIN